MWALVQNNIIVNIIEPPQGPWTPPEGCELVEITEGGIGWSYVGGVVTPPAVPQPTLSEAKTQRLSDLAAYRYGIETGGITVNGAQLFTDRESQATLTGSYVAAQLNPDRLIDWKASNGSWTQIDKTAVEFLAGAVADHVQHCFSVEKTKSAEIEALTTVEDVLAYDVSTGWL